MLLVGKLGDKNFWFHARQFCYYSDDVQIIRIGRDFEDHGLDKCNIFYANSLYRAVMLYRSFQKAHDKFVCFGFRWTGIVFGLINIVYRKDLTVVFIGTDIYTYKKFRFLFDLIPFSRAVFPGPITESRAGIKKSGFAFTCPWLPPLYLPKRQYKKGKDWIMLTRIDKNKNVQYAIDLFLNVEQNSNIQLHIYGNGPLLESLRNKHLDKRRILFMGFVDSKDIELENYSVFVQTSFSEGLSLALIEAVWSGLLPIVSKAGDESEFLGNDYEGYLCLQMNKDIEKINRIREKSEEEVRSSLNITINNFEEYEKRKRDELFEQIRNTK